MSSGLTFQTISTEKEIKRHIHPSFWQEVREYIFYFLKVFVSVAAIYLFIRTSVFDVIGISGKSMFPTYNDKDAIYIDQLTPRFSDYRRGDVVVLLSPPNIDGKRELFIKRVVGLPGEKVILDRGRVLIANEEYPQGVVLDESVYIDKNMRTFKRVISGEDRYEEPVLQADEYYVMGDNRTGSTDSRIFGKIKKSDILGREFFRILPPEKSGFFTLPQYNLSSTE